MMGPQVSQNFEIDLSRLLSPKSLSFHLLEVIIFWEQVPLKKKKKF